MHIMFNKDNKLKPSFMIYCEILQMSFCKNYNIRIYNQLYTRELSLQPPGKQIKTCY